MSMMSKQIHIDSEMRRLHGARRWLEAALLDKSVPIAAARRTMLLRAERPARERQCSDEVDIMLGRQYRDLKAVVGAIDAEQNTTAEDLSRLQRLSDQLRADSAHSGEILQRDKECLRLRTAYREPFTLPPKDEEGEKRRAEGVRALRAARGAVDRCQP